MSDDFIDKEEQNEENIPTPENGHLDYKPAETKNTVCSDICKCGIYQ